jgi:hypothetical protein
MTDLSKTTSVAKVNNVDIIIIENGEKRVAVKPICEALGIAHQSQIERLKSDPILSSVVTLSVTTGVDGKRYEMVTIPFKYVFGWLFRIDSRNVKETAKEAVERYQLECYDALYFHFTELDDYLKYRTELAELKFEEVERYRDDFKETKARLEKAKEEFAEIRALTLEKYRAIQAQYKIEFPAGE